MQYSYFTYIISEVLGDIHEGRTDVEDEDLIKIRYLCTKITEYSDFLQRLKVCY